MFVPCTMDGVALLRLIRRGGEVPAGVRAWVAGGEWFLAIETDDGFVVLSEKDS